MEGVSLGAHLLLPLPLSLVPILLDLLVEGDLGTRGKRRLDTLCACVCQNLLVTLGDGLHGPWRQRPVG